MAIFSPIDMMGPAHRGPQIQQLAQAAAKNVMRRQRLRALLGHSAAQAAGGGTAMPFNGSTHMRPTGVRGATFRAPGPGGGSGVFGAGGFAPPPQYGDPGMPDLPSLPDASDPHLPPMPPPPNQFDPASAVSGTGYDPSASGSLAGPPMPGGSGPSGSILNNFGGGGFAPTDTSGMIPLGGGMFYDPVTDAIHGGGHR